LASASPHFPASSSSPAAPPSSLVLMTAESMCSSEPGMAYTCAQNTCVRGETAAGRRQGGG
jgi:hypothetical protein